MIGTTGSFTPRTRAVGAAFGGGGGEEGGCCGFPSVLQPPLGVGETGPQRGGLASTSQETAGGDGGHVHPQRVMPGSALALPAFSPIGIAALALIQQAAAETQSAEPLTPSSVSSTAAAASPASSSRLEEMVAATPLLSHALAALWPPLTSAPSHAPQAAESLSGPTEAAAVCAPDTSGPPRAGGIASVELAAPAVASAASMDVEGEDAGMSTQQATHASESVSAALQQVQQVTAAHFATPTFCPAPRGACGRHSAWEMRLLDWAEGEERHALVQIEVLKRGLTAVSAAAAAAAAAAPASPPSSSPAAGRRAATATRGGDYHGSSSASFNGSSNRGAATAGSSAGAAARGGGRGGGVMRAGGGGVMSSYSYGGGGGGGGVMRAGGGGGIPVRGGLGGVGVTAAAAVASRAYTGAGVFTAGSHPTVGGSQQQSRGGGGGGGGVRPPAPTKVVRPGGAT